MAFKYDEWMEAQNVPIHKGFFIEDVRNVDVDWWETGKCRAAFIQLAGMQGITEARITEIQPGETLPPFKFTIDQIVYVASGRGLTTVWDADQKSKRTFEWSPRSLFLLPGGCTHQFSNMQGDRAARLLHYNYLPLAMSVIDDPDFYFNNPLPLKTHFAGQEDFFSEAKQAPMDDHQRRDQAHEGAPEGAAYWYGNFFPDMAAWDKLAVYRRRGGGGSTVRVSFPNSQLRAHMSVFPARTYKKGHRHGPGRVIIIPGGDGYSIMWQEGQEKIVVPWHEASLFVPPDRWFHQHFNTGAIPGRYLAMHPAEQFAGFGEKVEDQARDQIEYPDEDPMIRQRFEDELAKKGITSLMPAEAYKDRNYVWSYAEAATAG
jgi:gentisate 1,2-dioxygenase